MSLVFLAKWGVTKELVFCWGVGQRDKVPAAHVPANSAFCLASLQTMLTSNLFSVKQVSHAAKCRIKLHLLWNSTSVQNLWVQVSERFNQNTCVCAWCFCLCNIWHITLVRFVSHWGLAHCTCLITVPQTSACWLYPLLIWQCFTSGIFFKWLVDTFSTSTLDRRSWMESTLTSLTEEFLKIVIHPAATRFPWFWQEMWWN